MELALVTLPTITDGFKEVSQDEFIQKENEY